MPNYDRFQKLKGQLDQIQGKRVPRVPLGWHSVQRRKIMEIKCSDLAELRSIRIRFLSSSPLSSVPIFDSPGRVYNDVSHSEIPYWGYGLTENKQILRNMYRLGRKAPPQGYQLNDRGLVE